MAAGGAVVGSFASLRTAVAEATAAAVATVGDAALAEQIKARVSYEFTAYRNTVSVTSC